VLEPVKRDAQVEEPLGEFFVGFHLFLPFGGFEEGGD